MTRKPMTPGRAEDSAVQLEAEILAILRDGIGIHMALAEGYAHTIVQGMRQRMGGQEWYIPRPDKAARDAEIRRRFTGPESLPQLQREFGLTPSQIYRIAGKRTAHGLIERNADVG